MTRASLRSLPLLASVLGACAVSTGPSHETTPEDRTIFTELPNEEPTAEDPAAEEPAAEEEPAAGPIVEPTIVEPPCELEPEELESSRQLSVFRRWLQDQSVGRGLTPEELELVCGDQGGFMVLHLTVCGPAGGLQSMSRALEAYYPGSSWVASSHERLEGENYPLRIRVVVRIPTGESPRPRCDWDSELECD